MMGSRLAASLLRRGRDQGSALMTIPRLPRSAPAPPPAPPRVGSGSCGGGGGGGGHLLLRPPPQSTAGLFAASRVASYHAFRSFGPKSFMGQCTRKMSTTAAALNSNMANATANLGLKLLVTKGPQAQKAVGIWLFGCAAWVFSMVILGGVTRLTRSGLSMTDWKFAGGLPPMSEEEWLLEFEKYKQSPEYMRVNKGMNLEDFKFIYWMEYAHRIWGRALGFVFSVPFAYFVAKGYVTRQLGVRLSALFALGGAQGLIGWWMVKSGLEEPASEYVEPRVSPYRLAAHLTSAFVIYCGILWTALSVVMPDPPAESMKWVKGAAKFRKLAIPASAVVGITAISGAFVAGNDAGRAYNTFPKMGDSWIPEDVFSMEPFIRNFFENTSTVQLGPLSNLFVTPPLLDACVPGHASPTRPGCASEMADASFFDRMVSQLRSTSKYYTGYPKDLGPSRIIPFTSERQFVQLLHEGRPVVVAFTIKCTYTQHLDKVLEEAAAMFYPHVKFVRVECPKYPGFCLTRQKTEYPFLEVFYNPEQAANPGKIVDPSITKYSAKVLPFNYDQSVYGFREYFKKYGFKYSETN